MRLRSLQVIAASAALATACGTAEVLHKKQKAPSHPASGQLELATGAGDPAPLPAPPPAPQVGPPEFEVFAALRTACSSVQPAKDLSLANIGGAASVAGAVKNMIAPTTRLSPAAQLPNVIATLAHLGDQAQAQVDAVT